MNLSPTSSEPLPPFLARALSLGLMGADAVADCLTAHRELLAIGQELTLDDIAEIKGYLTADQAESVKQRLFAESSAPRIQALPRPASGPIIAVPEDPGIAASAFEPAEASAFFPPRPKAAPEPAADGTRRIVACSRCQAKIATLRPAGSLTVCPRCGGAFVIGGAPVEAIVIRKDAGAEPSELTRRLVACPACGLKVSTSRPTWAMEPCAGCGHDYLAASDEAPAAAPQAAPAASAPAAQAATTRAAPPPPPEPAAPLPEQHEPVASETLRRGSIIGPYRIESQLGRRPGGGVYVAVGPGGERVRLKVLGPEPDPLARASFLRQATFLIRSLEKHPAGGLLRPTARGEAGDLVWVATELAAGRTLAERITEGPIPEAEAAHLASLIARRLSELHEGGMVHRRLKPSNVLLEGGTDVALTDLGIGLPLADAVDEESGRFRAPELAAGQTGASDLRADLFALGAVFFDMIGGRLSSPALAVVIGALLDHNPAGRPATAAEVVRSIERTTKPRAEPISRPHGHDAAEASSGPGGYRGGSPPATGHERRVSAEDRLASAARRGWLTGAIVGAVAAVCLTLILVTILRGPGEDERVEQARLARGLDGGKEVAPIDPGAATGAPGGTGARGGERAHVRASGGSPVLADGDAPRPGSAAGQSAPVPIADDSLGEQLLRVRAAISSGDLDEARRVLDIATGRAPIGDPRCAAASAAIEQAAKSLRASLETTVSAWLARRGALGCPSCGFLREVACRACKGTGRDPAGPLGRCPTCGGCGRTPCAAPGCVRGFDRAALRSVAFDPLSDAARRAIEVDGIDLYVEGIAACAVGDQASSVLARGAWERWSALLRPVAHVARIDYEVSGGDVRVRATLSYHGAATVVEESRWHLADGAWRLDLGVDADARGGAK